MIEKEVSFVPNIKSAKKRVLTSSARRERNRADRSALRTVLKKFDAVANGKAEGDVSALYRQAVKSVDQAVSKGILHKNNAAHKKSALTLKLNKVG